MKTENEVIIDEVLSGSLPVEAQDLIKSESYQISLAIQDLKVTNREQYEKACEVGISNANILKRLEDLKKAILKPLDLEKKRLTESFAKAQIIFEENDEKIRKAMDSYQNRVSVENIKTIHTEVGRATVQERKDWVVIEGHQVDIPQEYWKLDEAKIGKVIRAGGTIPGIEVMIVRSTAFVAA